MRSGSKSLPGCVWASRSLEVRETILTNVDAKWPFLKNQLASGTTWAKTCLIFYCVFPRLNSGPPVSRRQDESRCHQVCIFIDQSERELRALRHQGRFSKSVRTPTPQALFGELRAAPPFEKKRKEGGVRSTLLSLWK